jgi:hypothetical protein
LLAGNSIIISAGAYILKLISAGMSGVKQVESIALISRNYSIKILSDLPYRKLRTI